MKEAMTDWGLRMLVESLWKAGCNAARDRIIVIINNHSEGCSPATSYGKGQRAFAREIINAIEAASRGEPGK